MTIYDKLAQKRFNAVQEALAELGKYFPRVLMASEDAHGAVIHVTGSFAQAQAFEPKFQWYPVVPEGARDPKAFVHWTTPLGLRRDPSSKRVKYVF